MKNVLLKIENLHKSYEEKLVLKSINLEVHKGEVVVILGPSGCGKSTLLRCINGLEPIRSGNIYLDEKSIVENPKDWPQIRQKIGMVFQSYELFPHMTILENIMLGPLKVQKRPKEEVIKQAESLLQRVGLLERKDDFPRQLSGGQRQRIAIVRALCMHPEMILFDEVTAALDPEMVREVLDVILELAAQGMTMMIVTHEMEFAKAVADRIVFMDEGIIQEITTGEHFFEKPQTERAQRFLNQFHYKIPMRA